MSSVPQTADDVLSVETTDSCLTVRWRDGLEGRFAAIWLLDCAPSHMHGFNHFKLHDVTELPADPAIETARLLDDGSVAVQFAGGARSEGYEVFPAAQLRGLTEALAQADSTAGLHGPERTLWGAELAGGIPRSSYPQLAAEPAALAEWLQGLQRYGFAMLSAVPSEDGQVARTVDLFGPVQETYFGRVFNVMAEPAPATLAETPRPLYPHTDLPYYDPTPQLQFLHCLSASSEGGESIVVDGFRAAQRLRDADPVAFELLCRTMVVFRHAIPGRDICNRFPIIERGPDGRLRTIRYNHPTSMAPVLPAEQVPAFYRACRRFSEELNNPASQVVFRLGPGELFAVDNRRVLHGRKAYAETGRRHLQGCYGFASDLDSRIRVLQDVPA